MNTLRRQILALFILIATVFLISVVYTLILLQQIGTDLDQLNQIYIPLSEDIVQLEANTKKLFIDTQDSLRIRDLEGFDIDIRNVQRRLKRIAYLLQGMTNKGTDVQALERDIELFQSQLDELRNIFEQIQQKNSASDIHRYVYLQTHLHVLSKKMLASSSNFIINLGQKASSSRNRAYSVGGSLGFIALLLTIVLSTIALRILSPIQQLTTQVQLIGKGDYSIRLPISHVSGQEITVLAREINHMAQAVLERDQSLQTRADELNTLSIQLEKVLRSISSGIIVVQNSTIQLINPVAQQDWNVDNGGTLPVPLQQFAIGDFEEVDVGSDIYNITVVPLQNDELLYSIRKVTEVVQNRKKLQRSERLALVGRLLAQVTHEVRNPLSSMHLNAEMLEDEELTQEGLEIVTGLIYEIRRLEQITERYLNLSRRPPIVIERVNLHSFLIRWVQEQKEFFEQRYRSECLVDIEGELFVNIDKNVMRRTLLNLAKNALEANCSKIVLSIEHNEDGIELLVRDDGEGVQAKEGIFEAFYTTKSKGTGLGLAICRQEIEEMGGRLYCKRAQKPTIFGIIIQTS